MPTVASLIANVSVTGAATSAAQIAGVGTSAVGASAYLDTLGASAFSTGVGFNGMASAAAKVTASTSAAAVALADADAAMMATSAAAADASMSLDAAAVSEKNVGISSEVGASMLGMLGTAFLAIGAAAVVGGIAAVKMAADFQTSMTQLVTSAGLAPKSLAAVSAGILKMSVDTGTSTEQLSKGMFNVESSLHLGAAGMQVLQAAAQGARAENSDLAQTTDVLTTAMVNYHTPASQAADVMNSLITTVAAGKMHMDDLTGSLKNALPVAAAFHIKLGDVEGALSTMANAGDRGTSAGTHLAMMFKMLESPVGAAKKAMADMGIDSIKLANTLRTSVPDGLKMIQDAVSQHFTPGSVEYNRAILAILGGSKSGVAGLEIMNQGLKVLGKNTDDAAAALRKGSKDVENWATIQGTMNFKLDAAKNAGSALMVVLGTELLPIFGKLLDQITPMITNFMDWETKTHGVENAFKSLVTGIGNMISVGVGIVKFFKDNEVAGSALEAVLATLAGVGIMLMIQSLVALGVAVAAATIPMLPMIATIALIALAVTGIILLIKNWGAIMDWLTGKTKESQLQQQELNQKNALKTIQSSEEQKRGVLANMEDERSQLIAKIKGMADGADKSREQIRLSALNAQINTTKGDLKELDNEKTQHLKILKDLQSQDPQIREQTKIAAVQKQLDTKNGVLKHLEDEKNQLIAKITNEKDSSTKNRDLMKLDAVNKQIDTTKGTIKALTDEGAQHKTKLKDMISSDLEARKGWYDRANDATTAWVNDQTHKLDSMIKSWGVGLQKWGDDTIHSVDSTIKGWSMQMQNFQDTTLNSINTTVQGWSNSLQTLGNNIQSWCGQTIGGWMSWLGSLVNGTATYLNQIPNIVSQALAQAAQAAFSGGASIVQGVANGIMGSIGNAVAAAQSLASAVANFLPHSPAKEGPLRDLDIMGGEISKQLATGMGRSAPTIKAAMNMMLSPIATANTASSSGVPMSSQQGITVIVNPPNLVLDGQRLTNAQLPYIVQGIRVATGMIV